MFRMEIIYRRFIVEFIVLFFFKSEVIFFI